MKKIGIIAAIMESLYNVCYKTYKYCQRFSSKTMIFQFYAFPFKKIKKEKNKNTFQDRPDPILKNFDFQIFCKK